MPPCLPTLPHHDALRLTDTGRNVSAAPERRTRTRRSDEEKRENAKRGAKYGRVQLASVDLSWVGEAVAAELPLKQRVCKNFTPLAKVAMEDTNATTEEYRDLLGGHTRTRARAAATHSPVAHRT